jgi:hypothetical protein
MQIFKFSAYNGRRRAFTFVEALIAVAVSALILLFAYRLFFSQTEVVTKSLEFLHVNEGFRKVVSFMGDDVREATDILKPLPVFNEQVASLTTMPGVVLHLQSSELNSQISFDSPFGGQIAVKRQVVYELEKVAAPESQTVPRYRLVRTSIIEEKPGQKNTQRQVLVDNVRELLIYRTVRKPFKPANISSGDDRLLVPTPLSQSGTGNSLIHLEIVLERSRKGTETGEVYNIAMNTSFYKRGKEIFKNP